MEEVSFGDFSNVEVNELYTKDCETIEFVWQKTPSSSQSSQSGTPVKRLSTTTNCLSPNIPPNPPTSPIDSNSSNADDKNKKLNINAMPFVPGNISIIIPPKDEVSSTENITVPKKLNIGTPEPESTAEGSSSEDLAVNNGTQSDTQVEETDLNALIPSTTASSPPSTTTEETRDTKSFTPTPPALSTITPTPVSSSSQSSTGTPSTTTPVSSSSQSSTGTPSTTTPVSSTGTPSTTTTPTNAWSRPKAWASILGKQSTTTNSQTFTENSKNVATPMPCFVENVAMINEQARITQLKELAGQLSKWSPCHDPLNIQPRGLINQGNWCYMHAPLQALLCCPAFFNLFHSLATSFPGQPTPSPVTDTMIQLVHEFKLYPKSTPNPISLTDAKAKKKRAVIRELHYGDSFRPDCVYDMLHKIKSSLSIKGKQEDAEEFLGCVLDGLHEEMLSATATLNSEQGQSNSEKEAVPSTSDPVSQEASDVEWEQVGPKNKSAITRQTTFKESPIAEIFGGELRSSVHRQKAKESATLQPFFSLQLDIQSDKVWDIKDALDMLSAKETVHMSEVEAHKKLSISRLPPVLILHLKRFVFDKTGGSQKLLKQVQYSTELEISKDLLSSRGKLSTQQRSYQLWAVVYHHGKTATGGHYTCDVNHPISGGWIRADDSLIKPIPEDFVLKPPTSQANKVAYILFYRRIDTIRT